jgi:uncharacterized protein YbjT (DUF2867 family)
MSIHLEKNDLINTQQMEVAVNGPDGATHLILCTGIADLGTVSHERYTFLVGPSLARRQFVGVIASGALSKIQALEKNVDSELAAHLILIDANFDEGSGQVKVGAEVASSVGMAKLAISYSISILAELPIL